MYAIALDIDSGTMEDALDDTTSGFDAIADLLGGAGFEDQGGSVYFGRAGAGPVEAVLAVRRMGAELAWLRGSLRSVRLLRIAEESDLRGAFDAGSGV